METDCREKGNNFDRETIIPDDGVLMSIKTEPEVVVEQYEKSDKFNKGLKTSLKMEKLMKRSPNWEQNEKDLLFKLVSDKMDIIEDPKIDTNTNKKKKEAWADLHLLFNSVSTHKRTLDQIQNQWRKTKSMAKIKGCAYNSDPIPKPLGSVEEDLVPRLPRHLDVDTNDYDSNLRFNSPKICTSLFDDSRMDHELFNNEEDTSMRMPIDSKRKKNIKCQCGIENENAKRMKLLDLSIRQKELEIKYLEENHNMQKRRHEMLEMKKKRNMN